MPCFDENGNVMPVIYIEYWNGEEWIRNGQTFFNEQACWLSLNGDDLNYRTIDSSGKVLTDRRPRRTPDALGPLDYFRKGDKLL